MPTSPAQVMELVNLASKYQKESLSNIKDAANYLKTMDNANESKIATIGWRFGVGQLLQWVLSIKFDSPLLATILHYENLVTGQEHLPKMTGPSQSYKSTSNV